MIRSCVETRRHPVAVVVESETIDRVSVARSGVCELDLRRQHRHRLSVESIIADEVGRGECTANFQSLVRNEIVRISVGSILGAVLDRHLDHVWLPLCSHVEDTALV